MHDLRPVDNVRKRPYSYMSSLLLRFAFGRNGPENADGIVLPFRVFDSTAKIDIYFETNK